MADKLRRMTNAVFLEAIEALMEHRSPRDCQLIAGEFIHRDGSWATEEQRRTAYRIRRTLERARQ
jgi:hypothetical protein